MSDKNPFWELVISLEDAEMFQLNTYFQTVFRNPAAQILIPIIAAICARNYWEFKIKKPNAIEEKFRELADALPQIIWTSDANGNPTYYNQKWRSYTNTTERLNFDPVQFLHPEDAPKATNIWAQSLLTGAPYQVELRIKRHDGSYRWHLTRAVPLFDRYGRIEKWIGTSTDIHDYKVLSEKIKASEEHLILATSAAELGIWDIDLSSDIVKTTPIYNKILGLETKDTEISVSRIQEQVLEEDRPRINEAIRKAIKTKSEFSSEFRVRHPNGKIHWVLSKGRCISNENNRAVRLYGINLDITERKEMEEQFKEAARKAREASQLKSAFLANMSHEIRTPLGAILGFTDLLREPTLSQEEKNHFFDVILRNGEQLSNLINDILDLSKVEAGQFKIEILKLNFPQIIHEVISGLRLNATEKKLSLNYTIDPDVPLEFYSDPTRLKQVLINVIGNAIKFTSKGHINIHVVVDQSDSDLIRIRVQDTGVGISNENAKRLFHPFSQADSSTTRKFGGTGLGLVLSRKLARALGGDLHLVSSELGVGSLFELTLRNKGSGVREEFVSSELLNDPSPIRLDAAH